MKHTLDDMRKFTGRLLVEHAALHLPKVYMKVLKENAGKDRQHRFWQPTQHPVGLLTEIVWRQKLDYLHDNPCRKGLVKSPQEWAVFVCEILVGWGGNGCKGVRGWVGLKRFAIAFENRKT